MAAELPEVTEGERHRGRTWAVDGKVFAWERAFSKADIRRFGDTEPPGGDILAVRVADLGEKELVLGAERKGFFTIPHFDKYPGFLIHLKSVGKRSLKEALVDAWLVFAPQADADAYLGRR